MAQEEVKVRLSADDEMSDKLDHAADNADSFGDRFKGSMESAEGASKAFAASVAVAGAAVAGIAVVSINAAREAIMADKQTQAVLESTKGVAGVTYDSVKSLADGLSKVTNFTDDAVQAGENMLLTFTAIGKDVFPQATETLLNMSQAMGTDTKQQAIQLGKALNNPIDGISALTRVGVKFTDEQKNVIKALVETGDVAGAQKVILAELETEFGGQARAAADPVIQLKNEIGNMAEAIGYKLMPYVDAVTTAFFKWLDSMGGAQGVVDSLFAALQKVAPFLPLIAGAIIGGLVPALYASASAFIANVVALAPFMIAGAAIAALALLIYEAWNSNFLGFRDVVMQVVNAVMPILQQFLDFWTLFKEQFVAAIELIRFMWETNMYGIRDIAMAVWGAIQQYFTGIWEVIKGIFKIALGILTLDWKTAWSGIKDLAAGIFDIVVAAAKLFWEGLKVVFKLGGEAISLAWGAVMDGVKSVASSIWEGIKEVFKGGINWIIDKLNAVIMSYNTVIEKVPGVGKRLVIPQIPKLAAGGIVTEPTIAMIGEAGPEAVVPLNRAGSMGGIGGVTVKFENNTFLGTLDDIAEAVGNAIVEKVSLHTSYPKY